MNNDAESRGEQHIFQIPSHPGNYPEDLLLRIKPLLDSNPGNHSEVYRSLHVPKKVSGIMLAADIRNFTRTLEKHDTLKVQHFVDQFFESSSDLIRSIDQGNAFINKLLGDGLFAHMPNESLELALDVSRRMIANFNGLKKTHQFPFVNLSIGITRSAFHLCMVGGPFYSDYTLIGPAVNSLFRMVSKTEGGMLWTTKDVSDDLKGSHHFVYIGSLKFKGIVPAIPCYSIIRKKTEPEKERGKVELCDQACENYYLCKRAWESGRTFGDKDPNEHLFSLDCNKCGEKNSLCALWQKCPPKYTQAKAGQPSICCHICKNFRNCYHSFQLGRGFADMIRCDRELFGTFL